MYALVMAGKDRRPGPYLIPSDVNCDTWRAEKRPQMGAGGPSPFFAGLKLEPTMSPEAGYVIERIERPTPN